MRSRIFRRYHRRLVRDFEKQFFRARANLKMINDAHEKWFAGDSS